MLRCIVACSAAPSCRRANEQSCHSRGAVRASAAAAAVAQATGESARTDASLCEAPFRVPFRLVQHLDALAYCAVHARERRAPKRGARTCELQANREAGRTSAAAPRAPRLVAALTAPATTTASGAARGRVGNRTTRTDSKRR